MAPRRFLNLAFAIHLGVAASVCHAAEDEPIGETPALARHLDQAAVEAGRVGFREVFEHGKDVFEAVFNELDGQGRPASTGTGAPRVPDQPAMARTSGPDASSCAGCHNQPRTGGGGDFVSNVFVLAQARDPVTLSADPAMSDERNSVGMFGAGPVEMLAREMTAELRAIRDAAKEAAKETRAPVRRALRAKDVAFGYLTAFPDGRIDPAEIEGIDWDLVVKPFHQKGAVVSLRDFTNTAMNQHHGMQSSERFGPGKDPDRDGHKDELTTGDITACTLFQAALPVPGRLWPRSPRRRQAAERGEALFAESGCTTCHIPALALEEARFTEPGPYNPFGNLKAKDGVAQVAFDLTREGPRPRLERRPGGGAVVRAFSDLKRHDLCDPEHLHFANERLAQGSLIGFAKATEFTVPPAPRPRREFLTRRLWDAGNSAPYGHRGDLTTLTAAIAAHGGEAAAAREAFDALSSDDRAAVIEFLKTLQVLPEGSPRELVAER